MVRARLSSVSSVSSVGVREFVKGELRYIYIYIHNIHT